MADRGLTAADAPAAEPRPEPRSEPRERALRLGPDRTLAGVLTDPVEGAPRRREAMLLLNSGIMHHIGTCRLSVKLARAAARAGFPALRFDFSGIGDSGPRRDALRFEDSAPQELAEVMEHLRQSRGTERFVLYGLCSGADMSYHTALLDPRIVGVVQIDGYTYKPWQYYARYYGPRLRRPGSWVGFARRGLARLRGRPPRQKEAPPEGLEMPSYVRVIPPKREVADGMQRLADRGVHMFNMYTGIWGYCYPNQFWDAFSGVDFHRRMRVEWLASADHIITGIEEQRYVVKEIAAWLSSTFPPAP